MHVDASPVVDEATELATAVRCNLSSVSEDLNSSMNELAASGKVKLSGAAAVEPVSVALGLHYHDKHLRSIRIYDTL